MFRYAVSDVQIGTHHSHQILANAEQRWRIDLFSDIASPQTQSNSLPLFPSWHGLKGYISSGTNMFHYSYKHNLPGISYYEYVYKRTVSKGKKAKMSLHFLLSEVHDTNVPEMEHIFGLRVRMYRTNIL